MSKKTSKWEKEAQEWMDKLNILDLQILNNIVYYKLVKQKREIIEKIIVWARTHHTGNIDETFEVNLSDLLRYLEKVL